MYIQKAKLKTAAKKANRRVAKSQQTIVSCLLYKNTQGIEKRFTLSLWVDETQIKGKLKAWRGEKIKEIVGNKMRGMPSKKKNQR